jgi:phosphoesterase RecJ-like protein
MPDFKPTAEFLASAPAAVLLTHERPDGDAIGSVAGLAHYFQCTGRKVEIWLYMPPPERYARLLKDLVWRAVGPTAIPNSAGAPWIVCDTCALNQLTPVAEAIKARGGLDWALDHHLVRDPICKGGLLDETASATGLLVYESVVAAGWEPHATAAEALFTAICTDTGWFRFSNADERTYRAAAGLLRCGVQPAELYDRLYQNDSRARLNLIAETLAGLEVFEDGRIAVMTLTQESFRRHRANAADTENITDEAARLRGVNVVLLFVEMQDGRVRCSFRSKRDIDVNKIAQGFGGGGHARASGARVAGAMADVKKAVIAAVTEAVKTAAQDGR